MEPQEAAEQGFDDSDDEFGAPEEIPIDLNRQINHAINSLTNALGQAHWKVGQHAAQIDALQMMLAEKENENVALSSALESELEHSRKLEGLLERGGVTLTGGPQQVDAFLQASQPDAEPALAASEQSAGSSNSTATQPAP